MLHISGQEFGGLASQKEYGNYYLRAEFERGEKTYEPRLGKARHSGIQYNITGPLKVWPRMMEFQINEGGTGDMWVVGGIGATVGGNEFCRLQPANIDASARGGRSRDWGQLRSEPSF